MKRNKAKRAAGGAAALTEIEHQGRQIRFGTYDHWALMHPARWAKFSHHAVASDAPVSTRGRPLEHRVHRDSKTIPGVIMAGIRMKIGDRFAVEPRTAVAAGAARR